MKRGGISTTRLQWWNTFVCADRAGPDYMPFRAYFYLDLMEATRIPWLDKIQTFSSSAKFIECK
jgi:hypothetical protein